MGIQNAAMAHLFFYKFSKCKAASYVEIDIAQPAVVKINKPLLILHGSEDKIIPHDESEKWAQKHAQEGNAVYYKTLADLGHNDIFDDQECTILTRKFLNNNFEALKELQLPQQ